MNPFDIFLGIVQLIVALLLVFRINTLPDFAVYSLTVLLVISGIMDLFDV